MLKLKSLLWLLPVFTLIAVLSFGCTTTINPDPEPPVIEPEDNPEANRVDVVYFYRAQRCHSCVYAEERTIYTLETYFQEELDNGTISFRSLKVQDSANSEIIEEYGAYTSQLFINAIIDETNHIEHIEDIWLAIDNDDVFTDFVKNKITEALEQID